MVIGIVTFLRQFVSLRVFAGRSKRSDKCLPLYFPAHIAMLQLCSMMCICFFTETKEYAPVFTEGKIA